MSATTAAGEASGKSSPRKGVEFFWGPDQEAAQEALKQEIINSPALRPDQL